MRGSFLLRGPASKGPLSHIGPLHLARAQMAELGSGGFIQL